MVPLPLFKLASLFVRHISKYGANRIKYQAHEHGRFRSFAAKYGQMMHQLNMRLNVALLKNVDAELKAKEKAEAPTVKTKEQVEKEEKEEQKKKDDGRSTTKDASKSKSVWKRKFRPLPEAKAVDLFADVIGDAFVLSVAMGLIFYEYWRSSQKPDANLERIKDLNQRFEELKQREEELEEAEKRHGNRVQTIEEALRAFKDPKTKQPLLPTPTT